MGEGKSKAKKREELLVLTLTHPSHLIKLKKELLRWKLSATKLSGTILNACFLGSPQGEAHGRAE